MAAMSVLPAAIGDPRGAAVYGHVGVVAGFGGILVSRANGVPVPWFWRISNAEPVDNSS